MSAKRKRKQSIIPQAAKAAAISSKATQSTIATYHTLLKRRSTLKRQLEAKASEAQSKLQSELSKVEEEIEGLGGIEGYQHASTLGQSQQRGGDSSKVLIQWLRALRDDEQKKAVPRLRMLEIGALLPDNYDSCASWIENHPIDLNSRHASIVEQDFLQRPLPKNDAERFDVISCSLVMNFVPDARDRGRMLHLCRAQLKPEPTSLLFIVLPLPCVSNSRYTTIESFNRLVSDIGFELVHERWRPNGKVAYWLWRWSDKMTLDLREWNKKKIRNDGKTRNNFAILL